jgi:ubiquitin-conjugating enzyme E2 O
MFAGPDEAMDVDSNEGEGSASMWEGDSVDFQSDEESAIDEVVEYEGGARLDDESGQDDWSTDEDTPESFVDAKETNDEDDSRDVEMGGTEHDEIEDTDNHTIHQRIDHEIESPETSVVGSPVSTDRFTRAFTAQAAPPMLVPNPEDSVRNPASVTLTQFLRQGNSPSNFDVLEQLPPSDQYHREQAPTQNPAFLKRIAKEHRILSSSLPANEIYVRTYESRLDLLRCLVVGPADTPYEYCPFVIDLHLGPSFPKEPPAAHFHSWTSGLGRINPNLYEEGKICLSLLGTWPGQSKLEGWSEKATILQLLVSLQGLVFVSRPFYNEAGFETYNEEKVYSLESQQYSEKAYVMARGFVKYALLNAPGGLEDVLAWLYLCKSEEGMDSQRSPRLLGKVIERAEELMHRSAMWKQLATLGDSGNADARVSFLVDGVGEKKDATKTFLKPLSQGAVVMLTKIVAGLKETLQRYE